MNNSFSVYTDPRNNKSIATQQQFDYINKTPDHNHDLHRQFDERSEQPRRSTKRLIKVSKFCTFEIPYNIYLEIKILVFTS